MLAINESMLYRGIEIHRGLSGRTLFRAGNRQEKYFIGRESATAPFPVFWFGSIKEAKRFVNYYYKYYYIK